MTPLALTFMILSWSFVLGLTTWCFARVLRSEKGSGAQAREPSAGEASGGVDSGGRP